MPASRSRPPGTVAPRSTTRPSWAPTSRAFVRPRGCPAPNALSDAGYMFTLSGADLIRDIYAYCGDLGERMRDPVQVKPGYAIKLALRLFLLDDAAGNGATSADNASA